MGRQWISLAFPWRKVQKMKRDKSLYGCRGLLFNPGQASGLQGQVRDMLFRVCSRICG